MKRTIAGAVISLGMIALWSETASCADEGQSANELKRLEGVWASTPAEKGRDRGHVIAFQGGRMAWHSFQTQDGRPVIGHTKLYDIRLGAKASPKQITATRGKGEDRETLLGIYELERDTLKLAFGPARDAVRPMKFGDGDARLITLHRDKAAKVPDLAKAARPRQAIPIDPTSHWLGHVADVALGKRCPDRPITTRAEFEKVWKALRGSEKVPGVDFAKEFVLVRTSTVGKVTKIELSLGEGEAEASESHMVAVAPGKGMDGLSYAIAVFPRDRVDVVQGRIVAKREKK